MYIKYVDESGDVGITGSPTKYYILSAIIVHESKWLDLLNDLIAFRRKLKAQKGLMMKEEIHASEFVSKRGKLKRPISPSNRLDILRLCLEWLASVNYINIISVRVDKSKNSDPFTTAWTALLQRFENTLKYQNFPTPAFKHDSGIIVADDTDVKKLTALLRKMRRFNAIPHMGAVFTGGSRNLPLQHVLKDPICRASKSSYFLQMVDVVAYFAKQYHDPNKYIKKKSAKNWYGKLTPVINQRATYSKAHHKIIQL